MKIYAIRHGQTELNKQKKINAQINEPLNSEGKEQAKVAAVNLPTTITHIYSSSLLRAQQTAEILNTHLQVPLSHNDELREVHLGSLAGKSWEEIDPTMELKKKHITAQFDYREYGGENFAEVQKRLQNFFQSIEKQHRDHEALIVTHGGIIRLLHLLEHGEPKEVIENVSLHEFDLEKLLR
jgi:broad specificity phosphatase PhoE